MAAVMIALAAAIWSNIHSYSKDANGRHELAPVPAKMRFSLFC
jgi:hypothetical protein